MKPTRTCNWPPRLDVELRTSVRRAPRGCRRASRPWRPVHPRLRSVVRWGGRLGGRRRFEGTTAVHIYDHP